MALLAMASCARHHADSRRLTADSPSAAPPPALPSPPPTTNHQLPTTNSPYDLAADLHRRSEEAVRELGPATATATVSETFLLAAPRGNAQGFAASMDLTKRTLDAYFNGRFKAHPREALSVFLFFDKQSYEAFCKRTWDEPCLSPFGFWRPNERRIVMNAAPGLGTLTHELVHPIVDADFPDAPIWINEGIASLFEAPVMPRPGEVHGVKNWRLPKLIQALKEKRADMTALFGMADDTFRDADEPLHYAMARYVCQWLDAKGELWPFYQSWRDDVANDPTGEKSFAKVTGTTPAEANAVWKKWAFSL